MTFLNQLPQRARLGKIFARYLLVISLSAKPVNTHFFLEEFGKWASYASARKKKKKTQVTVVPKMSTDHLFFHLPNPTPLC